MKIRNKLFLSNTAVFLMFILIFTFFILSSFRILALKDLQIEATSVRNRILSTEYANRAVLNSNQISIHVLTAAAEEEALSLERFTHSDSLRYLGRTSVTRIEGVYESYQNANFRRYLDDIDSQITFLRPLIYGESVNQVLTDYEETGDTENEIYQAALSFARTVRVYMLNHQPFRNSYITIANEIILELQNEIRNLLIQTGLSIFGGIIFSVLMILIIYRNMINKLKHVSTGIARVSSGDLLTRIEMKSNDELSAIGTNFNVLTDTIWQKISNIGSIIHNMGQSMDDEGFALEQTILNLAIENTRADSGAYYIADHENRKAVLKLQSSGFALPFEDMEYAEAVPFGQTIIGMTMVSGEPVFLRNLEGQNLIPRTNMFDRNFISSCMILPLISDRTIRGLLCLEKNSEKSLFSDMDFRNIQSFVEFSAISLNNLEQYSKLIESSGLNREMEIASDIQKSLLPPRLPRVGNFDITAKTYTLKGMSGDIYDFLPLGKNRWLFCMSEVQEKGIASSMVLVILRTLVRILVRENQEPAEMLNNILENFYETTGLETNLKISLCLMEPDSKTFHYCGTKGQKMLLFDSKTGKSQIIEAREKAENRYISTKGRLRGGVILLLLTDGFYDAVNEGGKTYGWDKVKDILNKHSDRSLEWLRDAVDKDITYFERHAEQQDDRTIFIARYKEGKK